MKQIIFEEKWDMEEDKVTEIIFDEKMLGEHDDEHEAQL